MTKKPTVGAISFEISKIAPEITSFYRRARIPTRQIQRVADSTRRGFNAPRIQRAAKSRNRGFDLLRKGCAADLICCGKIRREFEVLSSVSNPRNRA